MVRVVGKEGSLGGGGADELELRHGWLTRYMYAGTW